MVRRIINGKPFAYTISYNANNDYLTFFTLLCAGHLFINLPEKLLYYRIHGKNDTFTNIKQKFFNTVAIRKMMINAYGYKPTIKARAIQAVQFLMFSTFSERFLGTLYLYSKGIISLKTLATDTFSVSLFPFSQTARKMA
jgi:hypothetical protein